MVHNCVIKNCRTKWSSTSHLTFHRFPPADSKAFQIWLNCIPKYLINKYSKYGSLRICSMHFLKDDYRVTTTARCQLKYEAVPSVFKTNSANYIKYEILNDTVQIKRRKRCKLGFYKDEVAYTGGKRIKRKKKLKNELEILKTRKLKPLKVRNIRARLKKRAKYITRRIRAMMLTGDYNEKSFTDTEEVIILSLLRN